MAGGDFAGSRAPEVSEAVIRRITVPVIGCGAGPACHGCVIVTHGRIEFDDEQAQVRPALDDIARTPARSVSAYVRDVRQRGRIRPQTTTTA